jgi:hypothetical protein
VHYLTGRWRIEQCDQLGNVIRESICSSVTAPERARRDLVRARRAAEPEIDAAGEERFECAELLGNEEGSVVRQHNTARADADRRCLCGDVRDDDCRRRTRDARYSVVFGDPEAVVAQSFSMAREIGGIAKCLRGRTALNDRGEIENREWNCGESVVTGLGHPEE